MTLQINKLVSFYKRLTFWNTLHDRVASDEYWEMQYTDKPNIVGLCWVWCGTHIVGFFWQGFCVFGVEGRFTDEPSASIILWNHSFGLWFPHPEG